ncbi:hypothetical protein Taro_001272 [Colocasia esculenta]|uniref:Uncharacterized protein n=1 Tax=Colocasia esculenta TaxID=4460 RepID=A0A843TK40_COLES|nr:hypothetical protein [Colocasia esculenta]
MVEGYLTTFPNNSMEMLQQCIQAHLNVRNKEDFLQLSRVDILKIIIGRLLDFAEIATWPILFEEHCPRQANDRSTDGAQSVDRLGHCYPDGRTG